MKKETKIVFSLLALVLVITLIIILNSPHAKAQEEATANIDILGINPENIEKLPQTPEEAKIAAKNYLKKEWGKTLRDENSTFGKFLAPVLKGYDKISPYTNPIFKYTVGLEPSLTWLFILTFAIWITLITFFYRIFSEFSTFSKGVSFIVSFLMIVIISNLKIPLMFATWILNTISLLTSWWMQLILALGVIVLLILASTFSKQFQAMLKKWRKNREMMKAIQDSKEAKEESGKAKKEISEIYKTFSDIEKEK